MTNNTTNKHSESERIVLKRSLDGLGYSIGSGAVLILIAALFSFRQASFLFGCLILASLLILPVAYLHILRDDEPKLIMDEKGIYAKDVGQFTWESIREVWPEYYRGVCMLVLKLKDNEHYRLPISSLTMQPDDIRYYVEKQIAKYTEEPR